MSINIKKIIKNILPHGIVSSRENWNQKYYREQNWNIFEQKQKREHKVAEYFRNLSHTTVDDEIKEIVNYFNKQRFSVFPYDFTYKYNSDDIEVFYDKIHNHPYVVHENKNMYFPRHWSAGQVRNYYNGLLIEQDLDSPHRYEDSKIHVNYGDVVADIGAAEGIFSLTNIEKASKIYLFECDPQWIDVLKITFKPWGEKITIICKYISEHSEGTYYISFDDFISDQIDGNINFIKADIEGGEIAFLNGAKKTLASINTLQLVLCSYHHKNDATDIKKILCENGFSTEFSKRHMIFIHDVELNKPYLRKGVIRACKIPFNY
jgi:hypothetical protein